MLKIDLAPTKMSTDNLIFSYLINKLLAMAYQNICKMFRGNGASTNKVFMIFFLASF